MGSWQARKGGWGKFNIPNNLAILKILRSKSNVRGGTNHVLGKPCFCPLLKRGHFDENDEMTNSHSTQWKQGLRSSDSRKRRKWRKWRVSLRQRHGLEKAGFVLPWIVVGCTRRGTCTLRKDVFLPSKHLPSVFYKTHPSENPSKNLVFTENPLQAPSKNPSKKHLLLENLLRTLLRSVLLHDPLGVHLSAPKSHDSLRLRRRFYRSPKIAWFFEAPRCAISSAKKNR